MTFNQALKLLIDRERILSARRQSKALVAATEKAQTQTQALAANTDNNAESDVNNQQNGNNGRYRRGYRRGHRGRGKPHRVEPYYKNQDKQCWYCTQMGHMQNECPIRKQAEELQKRRRPAAAARVTFADAGQAIDTLISEATAAVISLTGSNTMPPADRISFVAD